MRLYFIVEGRTEENFVNQVLKPRLAERSIWASATCVTTRRKGGVTHRGGVTTYQHVQRDIRGRMLEDHSTDARFTTMFDLYRLPNNFPGYEASSSIQNPYQRVGVLEDALRTDLSDPRFIPYIQLHEFESLLLSDPEKLVTLPDVSTTSIQRLSNAVSGFDSPELINDGENTSPSMRIASEIPGYLSAKAAAGPATAQRIGLPTMRAKCPHFAQWLDQLESLA